MDFQSDLESSFIETSAPRSERRAKCHFGGTCVHVFQVEDELINHVKIHQMFAILKEDFVQAEQPDKQGKSRRTLCRRNSQIPRQGFGKGDWGFPLLGE